MAFRKSAKSLESMKWPVIIIMRVKYSIIHRSIVDEVAAKRKSGLGRDVTRIVNLHEFYIVHRKKTENRNADW